MDSEVESSPTTAAAEEEREEQEEVEKKEHPHIPRHIGVPVMGMDLMAEMKARMAVKKVGGVRDQSSVGILKELESKVSEVLLLSLKQIK